ncbi:MAG: hypothetical protein DWQ35_16015 [Planctomycetota bacterium]|nr:MAG: hypothetical protein DWQ35_16015 [Planctomycetota bacterium]REK18262.1 MAG: hypothetical protein DWQ42_20500 [Planctomycetota bacterium]REK49132.1 MAG: hypothetical protein DWQ46_01100 [Planctomycetota bacterium]
MRAATSEAISDRTRSAVRFRGRIYPQSQSTPEAQVVELPDYSSRQATQDQLTAEITRRVAFLNEPQNGTTMQLCSAFSESHSCLMGFRSDVEALVPLLCRANLEFRQESGRTFEEGKATVMKEKLDAMIEKSRLAIRPIANPVNAHLLALAPDAALKKLRTSLRQSIDRFVQDLFDALDRLVDREISGLVEWTSQNTCCYHFFRDVIVQDREDTVIEKGLVHYNRSLHGIAIQDVDAVDRGTHTHRIARHEYHTGAAIVTSIANTRVVLPKAVAELVNRIPDWLEPVVRIIDGTLVRAQIIEQDVETVAWEQRNTIDRFEFEYEPGVLIDHVVLTGWGPLDINAELRRREQEKKTRRRTAAAKQRTIWTTAAVVLSGLSIAWHWGVSDLIDLAFAFAMILAAAYSAFTAANAHAQACDRPFAFGQPFGLVLGLVLVLTGVGLPLAYFGALGNLIFLPILLAVVGGVLLHAPVLRHPAKQIQEPLQ